MWIEAGIDGLELHECANQQRGSDDQNQREGHLRHDQYGAELAAAKADAGAAAALVERGSKVGARGADRRHEAEENPGEDRDAEGKEQDGWIEGHAASGFADSRKIPGADGQEQTDASESENEAEKAAGQRERQALGQQLADDLEATSAERGAGRELALSYRGAHQQEIRDVGARNEQHEADRAEQNQQRLPGIANDRFLQRRLLRSHLVGRGRPDIRG